MLGPNIALFAALLVASGPVGSGVITPLTYTTIARNLERPT